MKPEAGQWWVAKQAKAGDTAQTIAVRIEHILPNGDIVVETYPGTFFVWKHANAWHHEPRCTGWDWVVPDQPQPEDPDEWVILDPVKHADHVLRKNIDFTNTRTGWEPICIWGGDTIGGVMNDYKGERVLFRCRRRDLPKVEQDGFADRFQKALTPERIRQAAEKENGCLVAAGGLIRVEQTEQCAGCHGPRCPNPALPGKDHCSECADWSYHEKQKPQPKKTMLRLWIDSDCNIHAGLKNDGDLELHYDQETRQFYTEEQQ